jgi:hypothetical protein
MALAFAKSLLSSAEKIDGSDPWAFAAEVAENMPGRRTASDNVAGTILFATVNLPHFAKLTSLARRRPPPFDVCGR